MTPQSAPQDKRTEAEQAACDEFDRLADARRPLVGMSADPENPTGLHIDHEDPKTAARLWMLNLGTTDPRTADALVSQLANLTVKDGQVNVAHLNQHMAFVQSIQPRDPLEAALAAQMSAVQSATMEMARRLGVADTMERVELYERSLNKLARTFTTQMEALKRYRTGGVQKVVVQHVQVNEGGQAVVAGEFNAQQGAGGGSNEKRSQPHEREQMRLSERSAVPCDLEAYGLPVQGAGR